MKRYLLFSLVVFSLLGCSRYAIKGPELATPRENETETTAPEVFDEDLK